MLPKTVNGEKLCRLSIPKILRTHQSSSSASFPFFPPYSANSFKALDLEATTTVVQAAVCCDTRSCWWPARPATASDLWNGSALRADRNLLPVLIGPPGHSQFQPRPSPLLAALHSKTRYFRPARRPRTLVLPLAILLSSIAPPASGVLRPLPCRSTVSRPLQSLTVLRPLETLPPCFCHPSHLASALRLTVCLRYPSLSPVSSYRTHATLSNPTFHSPFTSVTDISQTAQRTAFCYDQCTRLHPQSSRTRFHQQMIHRRSPHSVHLDRSPCAL